MSADTPVRGTPIAVHVALLLAIALAAAYVVNIAAVLMLPPRPPDVVRGDKVLDAFAAGYTQAKAGGAPKAERGARWTTETGPPRVHRGPHRGRMLARQLAGRLGLSPEKVVIAFAPTPGDVFVFRLSREERLHMSEEMREVHRRMGRGHGVIEQHIIIRGGDDGDGPPPAPPVPPEAPEPPLFAPPPPGVVLMSSYVVAAELPDGRWFTMRQKSNAATLGWIARAALGIGATLVVLMLLALLFAGRLAAPIRRFADSARRVGVDPGEAPVREEGPRELRIAARAVNAMQVRLRALVAERTEMLAAVAHDLRTPLMRMRLVAESADPSLRDKLVKEAAEIDALVSSFIAFARDDPTREARVRLDFAALVQSLCDDRAEAGQPVTFDGVDRLVLTGQALGLKRLVDNLVDNALKYGRVARVTLALEGGEAVLDIADDGPGVAPEEREKVFRPFVRGETAGASAPGAGLGLSAAREIARAHGGDVTLRDGAVVRVTLPV